MKRSIIAGIFMVICLFLAIILTVTSRTQLESYSLICSYDPNCTTLITDILRIFFMGSAVLFLIPIYTTFREKKFGKIGPRIHCIVFGLLFLALALFTIFLIIPYPAIGLSIYRDLIFIAIFTVVGAIIYKES
jgi:hypothetical protein